jgi:hypothetical protein
MRNPQHRSDRELNSVPSKVKPRDEARKQVIGTFDADLESEGLQGRVQGRPAKIIDAKIAGRGNRGA